MRQLIPLCYSLLKPFSLWMPDSAKLFWIPYAVMHHAHIHSICTMLTPTSSASFCSTQTHTHAQAEDVRKSYDIQALMDEYHPSSRRWMYDEVTAWLDACSISGSTKAAAADAATPSAEAVGPVAAASALVATGGGPASGHPAADGSNDVPPRAFCCWRGRAWAKACLLLWWPRR